MIRTVRVAICCLATGAAWASEGPDMSWIGHIEGVQPLVQAGSKAGQAVYQVTAEPGPVFKRIAAGLTERGWTINEGASVGESIKALTATQGKLKVEVGLTGTTLSVNSGRQEGDAIRIPGGGGATVQAGAGAFSVVDNNTHGSYECRSGDDGEVLGNNNELTVKGTCHRLTLAGNNNEIRVEGSVEKLEAPGNHNIAHVQGAVQRIDATGNHNQVVWSTSQNPKRPRVSNPGTGNDLHAE